MRSSPSRKVGKGEARMFNLIMIETAQKEREREIHEEARRRRLVADALARRELAQAPEGGPDRRDRRQGQPARLATP